LETERGSVAKNAVGERRVLWFPTGFQKGNRVLIGEAYFAKCGVEEGLKAIKGRTIERSRTDGRERKKREAIL